MLIMKVLLIAVLLASTAPHLAMCGEPTGEKGKGPNDWILYSVKERPEGTNVNLDDIASLGETEMPRNRLYLAGSFKVIAAAKDRVILRSPGEHEKIRVVVEYPASMQPPGEGKLILRDETNGFLIIKISRAKEGNTTVYVREVIKP